MDLNSRQKLVTDQAQSGLSAKAYCTKNNINYSNFMYWKKTIHKQAPGSSPNPQTFFEIIPRKKSSHSPAPTQFTFQFASNSLLIPTSLPEKELSLLFLALRKNGLC